MFSPKNRSCEFDLDGIVLNREVFEKILILEAENSAVTTPKLRVDKSVASIRKPINIGARAMPVFKLMTTFPKPVLAKAKADPAV